MSLYDIPPLTSLASNSLLMQIAVNTYELDMAIKEKSQPPMYTSLGKYSTAAAKNPLISVKNV